MSSEVCVDVSSLNREALTVRVLGKGNKERVVPYGPPAEDADHRPYEPTSVGLGETSGSASSETEAGALIRGCSLHGPSNGREGRRHDIAPHRATDGHPPPPGRSDLCASPGNAGPHASGDDPALHPRRQPGSAPTSVPTPCLTHAPHEPGASNPASGRRGACPPAHNRAGSGARKRN